METISYEQREKLYPYIKSIDGRNTNYHQWGINTRIVVGDDHDKAMNIVLEQAVDQKDIDMFFEGYWYGIETIIEDAKLQEYINDEMSKEAMYL